MAVLEEIAWRHLVTDLLHRRLGERAWLAIGAPRGGGAPPRHARAPSGGRRAEPGGSARCARAWSRAGALVRASKGRVAPAIVAHALLDWCVLVMFRLHGPSV
jgi:hypothetical protein